MVSQTSMHFKSFPVGSGGKKSCDLVFTPDIKHSKCTNTKRYKHARTGFLLPLHFITGMNFN